jgi:hypothetical protein
MMASLVFGLEVFEARVFGFVSAAAFISGAAGASFTLLVVLFED